MLMRKFQWIDMNQHRKEYMPGKLITRNPNVSPVRLGDFCTRDLTAVSNIKAGFSHIDASVCQYPDLKTQYAQAVNLISMEIDFQFWGKRLALARYLTMLDAGSRTLVCPDHGTHNGEPCLFDYQQYTLKETNYTQWGEPRQQIWKPNGDLDLSVYDVERNRMFVVLLSTAFPSIQNKKKIMLHPKIKQALIDCCISHRDAKEATIIEKSIQADDTPKWNHHLHGHVELYGNCDFEMEI